MTTTTQPVDETDTATTESNPQWAIEDGKWTYDDDDEKANTFWPSGRSARRSMLRGHRVPKAQRSRVQRRTAKDRAGDAKAQRRQRKRDKKHAAAEAAKPAEQQKSPPPRQPIIKPFPPA
ncbi:MAG: hypothetical protein CK431_04480 [Mycobacterium sp.]|nr:MAG: hypothetical protein CK431_04480 [Mycobacterium sp.]